MANKKSSSKSKGKSSSKRKQHPQRRTAKVTQRSKVKATLTRYVTVKTKSVPPALKPLKLSKQAQKYSPPPAPKKSRSFEKTKTYKNFAKQYKRKADKKYWKEIKSQWKLLYDEKGQPARIVLINIENKFVRNTKNRLKETGIKYWGREKWHKGKDGKWKEGKPRKRNKYRDRLLGNYVKGKKVGIRFLKVMEKDLIRKYMKKKRIKNYNKAKKRFWKEAESASVHRLVSMFGGSP